MKKIFILGGSYLQLDLILEAKKMFFYTFVLDADKNCIATKWCDKFLHIDITDKETILQKAKEYEIDAILTSATELGNITACYVGEQLGLYTNSYQTALNTTNKKLMKEILISNNIKTAKYQIVQNNEVLNWNSFPCIVKPSDSSAGRGLSYIADRRNLINAIETAKQYSITKDILLEEYIDGTQFSIETISCNGVHQIVAINFEEINAIPNIIERSHTIPAAINDDLHNKIALLIQKILTSFNIQYGACHIEIKVTHDNTIYVIELASRTGGMRSEMINLAYGVSYSQLLCLSSLNLLPLITYSKNNSIKCNFIIDSSSYKEYLYLKQNKQHVIFEPFEINDVGEDFMANNLSQSKGYYFLLGDIK